MMAHYSILFLLSTYTVLGQSIELGFLRGHAPTLRYLNGSCLWNAFIPPTITVETVMDSKIILPETDLIIGYILTCTVGNEVILNVTVSLQDTIPEPMDPVVDDNSILRWSHLFQPVLPNDFILIDSDLLYTVYVTDSEDSTRSLTANTTSIDISGTLDSCTTRTFTVQAMIDEFQSPNSNSTSISNFSVPVFVSLSAVLVRENDSYSVLVMFELGTECLLSVFTLTIDSNYTSVFNVTSDDIERGNVTFDLNISPVDVCSVIGVVSGGNDIGESEPVSILLPPECDVTTTTIVAVSSSTTVTTIEPTPSTPPGGTPQSTSNDDDVIIAVTVPVVIVVVAVVVLIILVLVYFRFRRRREKHELVDTETTGTTNTTGPNDGTDGQNPAKPVNYTFVEPQPANPQPANVTQSIPLETRTNYTQIDHFKTGELIQDSNLKAANGKEENNSQEKPGSVSIDPAIVGLSVELHLEPLMVVLTPVKGDWFNLGLQLKLSENFLDETETNIETEEECLREVLRNWLKYQEPTMEALNHALIEAKHNPIKFDTSREEFVRAVDL